MNEQSLLKKQFFKYMRNNIIIFIIIFIVFGIFVSQLVTRITYTSVNIELKETATRLKTILSETDIPNNFVQAFFKNDEIRNYNIINSINNPKVICIIRDEKGEIIASTYNSNFEEYAKDVQFDEEIINSIYEMSIDNEYFYRGITIDLSDVSEENGYIQLLMNVDIEKELITIYSKIINTSTAFAILISIIASIVMAKRTLNPLYVMIKKQNEFVQNVSHELRTPLTIIQAKQELLLRDPEAKIIDKTEEISTTLSESQRLAKIIKDLMLLTRADNKQLEIQKSEVEIDEFIENIYKTYCELFEIEDKKLYIDLKYKQMASIDTNKIYQVMVILLDNALKYTETGDSVTISTFLKDGKCVIEVKDTGIGISDNAINHVFERFYREDKARNRETGGSGLGLSIGAMIVSAHGGTIKATHNTPKGTVFTVRLPR